MVMSAQLGKDIAAARHKAKLSGKQLAERVGVSDGWVRQLETGRMKKPNPQKLAAVATELGMSVHTVLAMTDQLGADLTAEPASDATTLTAILERQVAINELLVARLDALEQIVAALNLPGVDREAVAQSLDAAAHTLASQPAREQSPRRGPGRRRTDTA